MKKMFAECISFNEGNTTKNIVLLVCGESLNPLSVHVLNHEMTQTSRLMGKSQLTVEDWDLFRFNNPELPAVELGKSQIEQVVAAKNNLQRKLRVIPRYDTQSRIALKIPRN